MINKSRVVHYDDPRNQGKLYQYKAETILEKLTVSQVQLLDKWNNEKVKHSWAHNRHRKVQ